VCVNPERTPLGISSDLG